jgi:hypothetical protein
LRGRGRSDACGGHGTHALLELGGALGCASSPLAQALNLARLGEGEQRHDRDARQRRERRYRANLGERVRQRQR